MLDKIQAFLRETGNTLVEATLVKHGIMHTEVVLKVKDFANISKVEKSLEGLPFYVKCPNYILMTNPEEGTYRLVIPHKDLSDVKFDPRVLVRPTQIYLGMDEHGSDLILDITDTTHAIVAGSTGSGKSMLIHSIIHSLIDSELVGVVFLDPKKVESQMYMGIANDRPMAIEIASSPEDIDSKLDEVIDWMEQRYAYMAQNNIRDSMESWAISQYKDDKLAPRVLIVDEVADLFTENKMAKTKLLVLSSKSRAAGLRIFLATQRPDSRIIDGAIKANFTTRICLKTSSAIDSNIVLGFPGAENLRGHGHALLLKPNGEVVQFKGAILDGVRIRQYAVPHNTIKQQCHVPIISADIKKYIERAKNILR